MTSNSALTISQAAAQLGVSVATLRRWTDRHQIPFLMTPGGQRRFTPEHVRQIGKHSLNTREAALELGISRSSLSRWADRGLIPHSSDAKGRRRFTWEHISAIRTQMRQPALQMHQEAA
jgi:excisionase family DNA binding protein